jgi:Bacterial membrane protein YfhO
MCGSRPTRSQIIGALSAGLLVVAFCLLLLWHDPLVFWNDDYELSVLPVFADMARSWSEGHWPILSPYSWVCGNLAGEFQYGTFSLFVNAVVVLIWKFPLAFPQQAAALSIAHLFVLAIGAFLLVRDRGLSVALSIFVALIASLNGWIICWGASDWFGALGAFTWLPWAWWGAERALDSRRTKWRFLWPAPFVYLLVTGGFPYTVLMLLLLIAWVVIKSLVQTRNIFSVVPMLFGVALGFGLSAPAWLALLDLVQGSARELQSSAAHWQWRVPPAALPGSILPSWTVNWTDFSSRSRPHAAAELACGLVAPAALVAGFVSRRQQLVRRLKWELILLLVVLLLCMTPTAGLFRWSFRWLPFFHLVLAICAAEALHLKPRSPTPATAALGLVVLASVATLIFHTTASYAFPLTWIFIGLAAVWVCLEFLLPSSDFQSWVSVVITFCALVATYLCFPTNCGVPRYNFSQELLKPEPLDPQRLYLSVYPWAELTYAMTNKPQPVGQTLRPGNTSMWAGLRFINGYSPIRAAGVAREFATSIHGEINPDVGTYLLNHQAGRGGELELMGVDGIVVAREVDIAPQPRTEWHLVVSTDEGNVFQRRSAPFSRVRSVTSIDSRPNEQFVLATISRINDSRNFVNADIDVPAGGRSALLTFSRPYFRGYKARIGDQKLAVTSYRGLFPILEVPAGTHGLLIVAYRPAWLLWGGGVAAVSGLIVLLGVIAACRYSFSTGTESRP